MFDIPYHWPIAGRLTKKIFNDFKNKVSYEDFKNWNGYKKYQYINKGRYPLTVEIRNTKKWECYSDFDNDYIKMNINICEYTDTQSSSLDTGREKWEDLILTTLAHEVTHYFQYYFDLGQNLDEKELQYFSLPGNGDSTSYRRLFLYLSNWTEMDADLSAIHFAKNYKNITKKTLEDYYNCFCPINLNLSKILADYVYNYWWNDFKDFNLRKKIENKEINLN